MPSYDHFWTLAREVRAYCKETGLRVLSKDDRDARTIGFVTDVPEDDPRYRAFTMRLADVIRTGNQRTGFEDFTDAEMITMTHPHLSGSEGRVRVAEVLSLGILGPVDVGPVDSSSVDL